MYSGLRDDGGQNGPARPFDLASTSIETFKLPEEKLCGINGAKIPGVYFMLPSIYQNRISGKGILKDICTR